MRPCLPPVGRAQHHAPVCSKATRARPTGFSHRVGAPKLQGSGPLLLASPHPNRLRTSSDPPAGLAHNYPKARLYPSSAPLAYRGGAMQTFTPS